MVFGGTCVGRVYTSDVTRPRPAKRPCGPACHLAGEGAREGRGEEGLDTEVTEKRKGVRRRRGVKIK